MSTGPPPGSGGRATARDLRPLAAASVTAVVSVGVLALAIRGGWLGPDVGQGDGFCEVGDGGWLKQPANALSNAGFVVAGLLVAWRAGDRSRRGSRMRAYPGLATAYACVVVLLGPGSAAMHGTGSALGGHLDLLSMYLIAGFAAAYALVRWTGAGTGAFWATYAGLVLLCEGVGALDVSLPVVHHPGNAVFGLLLIGAMALEVAMARSGRSGADLRYGGAAVAVLTVAFVIWNLAQGPWCDPGSWLQGHAAWHLLDAVAAYLLFLMYAGEGAPAPDRPREVVDDRAARSSPG